MSAGKTFEYTPATGNAFKVEVRDGKVFFTVVQRGRYGGEDMNLGMTAEVPARVVFDLADVLETAGGYALYEELFNEQHPEATK